MSAPDYFIRSLIRWAKVNGWDALEALSLSQTGKVAGTGRQLTAVTANGKSFSYSIPQGMTAVELIARMEEALELCDSLGEDGVITLLMSRPITSTTVSFH